MGASWTSRTADSSPWKSDPSLPPDREQQQLLGFTGDRDGRAAPGGQQRRSVRWCVARPGAGTFDKVSRPISDTVRRSLLIRSGSRSRGSQPDCGTAHILVVDEHLGNVGHRVEQLERRVEPAGRTQPCPPTPPSRCSAATWFCTFSVWPAKKGMRMPGAASSRCSLITRWAAKSRVRQPSHRVGASGPVPQDGLHQGGTFASCNRHFVSNQSPFSYATPASARAQCFEMYVRWLLRGHE